MRRVVTVLTVLSQPRLKPGGNGDVLVTDIPVLGCEKRCKTGDLIHQVLANQTCFHVALQHRRSPPVSILRTIRV